MELDKDYWSARYRQQNTPWDVGYATPPLVHYLANIADKQSRILIPGCGTGHEAAFLHQQGHANVFVCDWAEEALAALQSEVPDFPPEHLLCMDFFDLQLQVDYLIEQTFFCAIAPSRRTAYVDKAASLLPVGGVLAGLLFSVPFEREGPPFGGSASEYERLFSRRFQILRMQPADDSIKPRLGHELFVEMRKL
jgi:SAM-dependent methyltransferase